MLLLKFKNGALMKYAKSHHEEMVTDICISNRIHVFIHTHKIGQDFKPTLLHNNGNCKGQNSNS